VAYFICNHHVTNSTSIGNKGFRFGPGSNFVDSRRISEWRRRYSVALSAACDVLSLNKCIGDDTKAAARQSLNCIKTKKIKYGEKRCSIWQMEFLHPAMWYVALGWHAIEYAQTSAILEFYSWFRFRPHHRSRHVILHQSPKFYPNRTTLSRKNDVMSIFKMADLSHLRFYGSNNGFFEKPMYDFL